MSENALTGTIPLLPTSMTSFTVSDNQLSGPIEHLILLNSLEHFYARNGILSGTIPSGLCRVTMLSNLDLSNNYLVGYVPSELGQLSGLTDLRLDSNILVGELPTEINRLTKMTSF